MFYAFGISLLAPGGDVISIPPTRAEKDERFFS